MRVGLRMRMSHGSPLRCAALSLCLRVRVCVIKEEGGLWNGMG